MTDRPRRLFRIAALLASLLVAVAAAAPAGAKTGSLLSEVEVDHPVVHAGSAQPVYVLVRLKAPDPERRPGIERPPLNLALVLDRSGSMGEANKLPYLKRAAKSLVDRLTPGDWLALVEYNHEVSVAWPSAPVESPRLLSRMIDDLVASGNTDLTAGMMAGVAQVRGHYREASVNRVLLLSDGLANHGITAPAQIRELVLQARRRGIPITTLGLGLQYDEDLLQAIAETSGGSYHYIEDPSQTAAIFQQELSTLIETAARDVELRFTPGPAVAAVQVLGHVTQREDGATVAALPDFYAGEARSLVLRLELKSDRYAPGPDQVGLGELRLAYDDVSGGRRAEESRQLAVEMSDDAERVRRAANKDAVIEAALVETEAAHRESLRLLAAGRGDEARQKLEGLADELEARNAVAQDARLAKKVEALRIESQSVTEAAAAPTSAAAQSYVKRSKHRLYEAKQGKRSAYMLKLGDSGPEVARLQQAMAEAGIYTGPIDGDYTDELARAVEAYQAQSSLAQDGIAGPATLKSLGLY